MAESMPVDGVVITSPGFVRGVVRYGYSGYKVGTYCGSRLRSYVLCPIGWLGQGEWLCCLGSHQMSY